MDEQYLPKTKKQALAHLTEELGEAVAAAGKCARFGFESTNPELGDGDDHYGERNIDWLRREVLDLIRAYGRLEELVGKGLPPTYEQHDRFYSIVDTAHDRMYEAHERRNDDEEEDDGD